MACVDAKRRLVRFALIPGNAAEHRTVLPLLDGVDATELIADKAYDVKALRFELASRGIVSQIPSTRSRKLPFRYDAERYKLRHVVENWFADLKQFRGLATRYCKLVERFRAFVCLAAWVLATR